MDPFNEVTDDEFVPFLKSLGVETYKKSFEWMLNDPDFSGILRWLYNNLDRNNALDAREECRYLEIQKRGDLLSPEDLEAEISGLLQEHPGLPLPGDYEALEDMKFDITLQNEKLAMLEAQENMLEELIKQNESSKSKLISEVTTLNSALSQSKEEERTMAQQCISLAQEVQNIEASVIDAVGASLATYGNTSTDKDIASKFFTFGPFESYRQTQALFRSHFDLYTSKKFDKKQNDILNTDHELRNAMIEARAIGSRLTDAIRAYIESKCGLAGEQAKLELVQNYEDVHHAMIPAACIEAKSATEISEQEESILEEQIQTDIKTFVEGRTKLVMDAAVKAAYDMREEVVQDLTYLHEASQSALTVDSVVYYRARHELTSIQHMMDFAYNLMMYVEEESAAVECRIESMNSIITEQELCHQRLQSSDRLLSVFQSILSVPAGDATALVKRRHDVKSEIKELMEKVDGGLLSKEMKIEEYKKSSLPIKSYLYDGCTKQPNCWDRGVAALSHSLAECLSKTEEDIGEASRTFTSVRSNDKKNLRKLWQWFLSDAGKLLAVIKHTQSKSYS